MLQRLCNFRIHFSFLSWLNNDRALIYLYFLPAILICSCFSEEPELMAILVAGRQPG